MTVSVVLLGIISLALDIFVAQAIELPNLVVALMRYPKSIILILVPLSE